MKQLICRSAFILSMLGAFISYGQNKHSISGVIKEKATGETVIGATVAIGNGSTGTISNEYGFYSMTLPEDTIILVVSYVGFQPSLHKFYLSSDTTLNIEISDEGVEIGEVLVRANSNTERVNSTQMGVEEISVKEAKEIAAIFGEVDIIKVMQLKPGVQSGTEGSAGVFVRGGGADQNFFILDEAPVYNPSHLFGFFSTFNADAIKNVKLYKAGFPSQYGGKLSSVIDIRMREGNRKRFEVTGGLGLISSRLTVEGPLKKDKGAFVISGRRTYVDLFTNALNRSNADNPDWNTIPSYSFYDLNAKFNYDLGAKDRVFLSGYFGRDVFNFVGDQINFNFDWGNIATTARWNHQISPQMFVNTSFTFSDYVYDIKNQFDQFNVSIGSGIRDVNLKSDFTWLPSVEHELRFGANAIYHQFKVNRFDAGSESGDLNFNAGSVFDAGEFGAYISDDWTVSDRLKLLTGVRVSGFYNEGKFYQGLEPRAALKYSLNPEMSLKASYARMNQYIHLISTSGASLPTDVWYPSNKNVTPQTSDLASAGFSWAIGKELFFSTEFYYKWLHRQIDFRDGANLFVNDNLDQEFIFGKGKSYGGEVYLEKKRGDFRGWIGYTLSWTWRSFDEISDGKWFHPKYDRRHDVSIVAMYDLKFLGPKYPLTLSATWVYGTGNAESLPVGRYIETDIVGENPYNFVPIYTERGGFRMPAYHRMDLGLIWDLNPLSKKRFKSDLTFSIYNVYNRRNPFFMFIETVYAEDDTRGAQLPERFQAKLVSLFPIIPSISWNFKF